MFNKKRFFILSLPLITYVIVFLSVVVTIKLRKRLALGNTEDLYAVSLYVAVAAIPVLLVQLIIWAIAYTKMFQKKKGELD